MTTPVFTSRVSSTCPPAATTTRTLSDLANTIFTPPGRCLDFWYEQVPSGYDSYTRRTRTTITTISGLTLTSTSIFDYVQRGRDPTCFPSNYPTTTCYYSTFISSTYSGMNSEMSYVYSPGRCPQHYATLRSSVDEVNPEITRAVCCPNDFGIYDYDDPGLGLDCLKIPTIDVTYLQSAQPFTWQPNQLWAPTINIAWQQTDLARWANGAATSTPTSSMVSPSVTPSASPSTSGLSSGAKAGIGVGAAAVALIGIGVIAFLVLRRRKRAGNTHQNTQHDVIPGPQQTERHDDGKRHSEMTTLQSYSSPAPGYRSPSLGYQSPPQGYQSPPQGYQVSPQGYQSPPQEYYQTSKPETFRHVAEGSDPAELETGWRGWEASTGNPVGTNGGNQIHAQGVSDSQDLPIRR